MYGLRMLSLASSTNIVKPYCSIMEPPGEKVVGGKIDEGEGGGGLVRGVPLHRCSRGGRGGTSS